MSRSDTSRARVRISHLRIVPGFSGLSSDLGDRRVLWAQILLFVVALLVVGLSGYIPVKDIAKSVIAAGVLIWAVLGGNMQRNLVVAYLVNITLPFVFFSEHFYGAHYVDVTVGDLLVVLVFLPWVVGLVLLERKQQVPTYFVAPILLLLLASVISLPVAHEPRLSILLLALMAEGGIAFVFIVYSVQSRKDYNLLVFVFIAIGVYLSAYGIMQFMSGSPELLAGDSVSRAGFGGLWSGRVRATLAGPNALSGFLVLVIPLALARLIRIRNKLGLLSSLGAVAMMLAALALTFSRNGYVCFVFSLVVVSLLLVWKYRNVKLVGAVGLLGLALVAGVTLKLQPAVLLRLISIRYYMYDPASVLRLMFWKGTIGSFLAHPLTGIGLGNFVHQPYSFTFIVAHNIFFNTMGETGIFGIIGLVTLIVVVFRKLGSIYRRARDTYTISESIGLLGSWTALVVHGVFDCVWSAGSHTREIKYIWVFLALTLIFVNRKSVAGITDDRMDRCNA